MDQSRLSQVQHLLSMMHSMTGKNHTESYRNKAIFLHLPIGNPQREISLLRSRRSRNGNSTPWWSGTPLSEFNIKHCTFSVTQTRSYQGPISQTRSHQKLISQTRSCQGPISQTRSSDQPIHKSDPYGGPITARRSYNGLMQRSQSKSTLGIKHGILPPIHRQSRGVRTSQSQGPAIGLARDSSEINRNLIKMRGERRSMSQYRIDSSEPNRLSARAKQPYIAAGLLQIEAISRCGKTDQQPCNKEEGGTILQPDLPVDQLVVDNKKPRDLVEQADDSNKVSVFLTEGSELCINNLEEALSDAAPASEGFGSKDTHPVPLAPKNSMHDQLFLFTPIPSQPPVPRSRIIYAPGAVPPDTTDHEAALRATGSATREEYVNAWINFHENLGFLNSENTGADEEVDANFLPNSASDDRRVRFLPVKDLSVCSLSAATVSSSRPPWSAQTPRSARRTKTAPAVFRAERSKVKGRSSQLSIQTHLLNNTANGRSAFSNHLLDLHLTVTELARKSAHSTGNPAPSQPFESQPVTPFHKKPMMIEGTHSHSHPQLGLRMPNENSSFLNFVRMNRNTNERLMKIV